MRTSLLFILLILFSNKFFCQVAINSSSPTTTLDVVATNPTGGSTNVDGLLIPRLSRQRAQAMTATPTGNMIFVNEIASGTATGTTINVTSIGFYFFNGTVWEKVTTGNNNWATTGNAGTSAATNFIGTTDATDLVFRTNGTERFRVNNGVGPTTGTVGDISIGNPSNGTIKSNLEFVLRQDGDTFGSSVLRLRNRNAENGAIFENLNPTVAGVHLVDFIFKTGTTATPIQTNIRFETRTGSKKMPSNATEWQFGQPDTLNGGPTLVVGAAGTGSNSSFRLGNLGVGTVAPTGKLHVFETTGTAHSATQGTLVLDHGNNGGSSSIVFPSRVNNTSDYAYINYSDDGSGNGSSSENSLLEIGIRDDDNSNVFNDDIAIMPSNNFGVGTIAPKSKFHNNGTTAFTVATSGTNNTIIIQNAGTFATPTADSNTNGRVYIIRNTSTTANLTVNSVVDFNSSTAANFSLTPAIGSIMIVCDGTNWFRIN